MQSCFSVNASPLVLTLTHLLATDWHFTPWVFHSLVFHTVRTTSLEMLLAITPLTVVSLLLDADTDSSARHRSVRFRWRRQKMLVGLVIGSLVCLVRRTERQPRLVWSVLRPRVSRGEEERHILAVSIGLRNVSSRSGSSTGRNAKYQRQQ